MAWRYLLLLILIFVSACWMIKYLIMRFCTRFSFLSLMWSSLWKERMYWIELPCVLEQNTWWNSLPTHLVKMSHVLTLCYCFLKKSLKFSSALLQLMYEKLCTIWLFLTKNSSMLLLNKIGVIILVFQLELLPLANNMKCLSVKLELCSTNQKKKRICNLIYPVNYRSKEV